MTGVGQWSFISEFWLKDRLGKVGKESAAAKYAAATESNQFSIENEKPYAEVSNLIPKLFAQAGRLTIAVMDGHPSLFAFQGCRDSTFSPGSHPRQ